MPLPVKFPGYNRILHGPRDEQGNSLTDILDLPTFTNDVVCVSCWELNDYEKQQLNQTLGIYIYVFDAPRLPIYLSALCPNLNFNVGVAPIMLDSVYSDDEKYITYWELSDDEIEYIQRSGKIWFTIQSGETQPPVGFLTQSPFEPSPVI